MTRQQSSQFLEIEPDVWEWTSSQPCVVIAHGHLIGIAEAEGGGLHTYVLTPPSRRGGRKTLIGHGTVMFGELWFPEPATSSPLSKLVISAYESRNTGRRAASKGRGSSGGKK